MIAARVAVFYRPVASCWCWQMPFVQYHIPQDVCSIMTTIYLECFHLLQRFLVDKGSILDDFSITDFPFRLVQIQSRPDKCLSIAFRNKLAII